MAGGRETAKVSPRKRPRIPVGQQKAGQPFLVVRQGLAYGASSGHDLTQRLAQDGL